MKKDLSSQSMDAALQDFLGNKPSMETPSLKLQSADMQEQASDGVQETVNEPMPEQADEIPQVVRASAASNAGHRWKSTRNLFSPYRSSKTVSPCSSAAARAMPSTASSECSASAG